MKCFTVTVTFMRGLVLNFSRSPDVVHLLIVLKSGKDVFQSKAVPWCPQNLYTEIPINEDFAL
jgi:hypothetical protein